MTCQFMKFELVKTNMTSSVYNTTTDEVTECHLEGRIFYVKGYPAFMILENGEVEPITPNGCHIYMDNRKECDEWLRKHSVFNVHFPEE